MTIQRHVLDADDDQTQNMRIGIAWLDKVTPPGTAALLATGAIGSLDGIISSVIGAAAVKALRDRGVVRLPSGGRIALMTMRKTPPSAWRGGPVLVVYGGSELLDRVDELHGVTHVLAIPWNNEHAQAWIATWNVPRLGGPTAPARKLVDNYVVENALTSLARTINISDGGTHPSDHAATVQLFKLLKQHGEAFDPDEVRAWFVAEAKMAPKYADGIRDIAQKVRDGRSPRTRDALPHWRDGIIETWRRKA